MIEINAPLFPNATEPFGWFQKIFRLYIMWFRINQFCQREIVNSNALNMSNTFASIYNTFVYNERTMSRFWCRNRISDKNRDFQHEKIRNLDISTILLLCCYATATHICMEWPWFHLHSKEKNKKIDFGIRIEKSLSIHRFLVMCAYINFTSTTFSNPFGVFAFSFFASCVRWFTCKPHFKCLLVCYVKEKTFRTWKQWRNV